LPDTAEPDTAAPDPVKPEALLNTDSDLIPTTTTIPTTTKGGSRCSEFEADRIEFAAWVPEDLKAPAMNKVSRLDTATAQIIIDEWAGSMATGRIERSPLGYLHALVSRLESGRFRLQYADAIEAIRKGEDRKATG
jgi:hypothetical protein